MIFKCFFLFLVLFWRVSFCTTTEVGVSHEIVAYDRYGAETGRYGIATNMITDYGLNLLPTQSVANCFMYLHVGTSSDANARYSDDITISGNGAGGITATSAFFQADDISGLGREIVFSDGTCARITGFSSETEVTIDSDFLFSGLTATIYKTELTALTAQVDCSSNMIRGLNGSTNFVSSAGLTNVLWRVFKTNLAATDYTIREVGVSPSGSNLFARLVLDKGLTVEQGGYATDLVSIKQIVKSQTNDVVSIIGVTNVCIGTLSFENSSDNGLEKIDVDGSAEYYTTLAFIPTGFYGLGPNLYFDSSFVAVGVDGTANNCKSKVYGSYAENSFEAKFLVVFNSINSESNAVSKFVIHPKTLYYQSSPCIYEINIDPPLILDDDKALLLEYKAKFSRSH